MEIIISPLFHMWFTIGLTIFAIVMFSWEKLSIEMISLSLAGLLLLFGNIFPFYDETGKNLLNTTALLLGFANPALFTVLALLVIGQAILQVQALNPFIRWINRMPTSWSYIVFVFILFGITIFSGILNNTPLVILAIPILQAVASNMGRSSSRVMIPLSYAAILGGMVTLIGSSTNLLVSGSMNDLGLEPFSFFEFTHIGIIMALVGLSYIIFILPKFLPQNLSLIASFFGETRQFIAEIDIEPGSRLIGEQCIKGKFKSLPDLSVRLIHRAGNTILPPFENYTIQANDIIIVAATREALTETLTRFPGFVLSSDREEKQQMISDEKALQERQKTTEDSKVLAEVMIAPGSRLIDRMLSQISFYKQYGCVILGLQRRARMMRRRLKESRFENSDTLLVLGPVHAIEALRNNRDFVVLAGTTRDLPTREKAPLAFSIFAVTIGLAAFGVISIPAAAFAGAVLMVMTGCLNIRQAVRAIDRKIFFLIGSVLALGHSLQATGGAQFIAESIMSVEMAKDPLYAGALLFIVVAILTNILTNNACAIIFTPIAISLATSVGVDPRIFALAVLFAANCSFATPIGYQTNLLVMSPGNYKFKDFIKAGLPLVIVMWITFCIILKFYYNL